MKKNIIYYFLIILISYSCDLPQEKPASITEAKKVQEKDKEEMVNIINYTISAEDSKIKWIGSKPTGKHHGTFGIEDGKINVKDSSITGGKIIIDMTDIEVQDLRSDEDSQMKLTEHLKSPDFFDVENYPEAIFEITSITKIKPTAAEESKYDYEKENKPLNLSTEKKTPPTHEITGNLTMRGKSLSVTFPGKIQIKPEYITTEAKFSIDRTLWGVKYREEAEFKNKAQDKLIYNNVDIVLDIVAYPEKEIL